MMERPRDPRTEDTIRYELVRTHRATGEAEVVGTATFANGRTRVDASEDVAVAVQELLDRAFVDRVQADERPRGYRRSGKGVVDMLVPGMPEHFIARLRGLWLSYPDGTVITAREPASQPGPMRPTTDTHEAGAAVTDASVRRASLNESDAILNARPLVIANEPITGLRPVDERIGVRRTDCGWFV